ncbi:hypothetical protein [Actinotalea subterranea]|uniref:hypothetical protein n=1 Tax=Actinotalea subterranea TaxID=2607497 RepID=UPI00165E8F4F|nr:hypothetical protein [Actinotalea subterranea]
MSDSTGRIGGTLGNGSGDDGRGSWPFDQMGGTGAGAHAQSSATPPGTPVSRSDARRGAMPASVPPERAGHAGAVGPDDDGPTGRRRPPVWLLAGAGVLVVGAVVAGVLLMNNRGGGETPEAETVTLPAPTPTIAPVERAAGTAFFDALPSTVLSYALTEAAASPDLLAAGALESYRLVYSDGGTTTLTTLAGQWATAEAATGAYQRAVTQLTAAAGAPADDAAAGDDAATDDAATDDAAADDAAADDAAADDALTLEEGAVTVDGTEVGRYTFVPRADGTGTVVWTNGSVLVQVDGPAEALRDVHAGYTL